MSFRKKLKHNLVFVLTKFMFRFFNSVNRRLAVFLGGSLGSLYWFMSPRDRYRIHRHLTLVYKDRLTDSEKYLIGREFFINSGKNLVDVIRLRKYFDREIKGLVTTEGLEHFDRAYKRGHGIIGITGHVGNFELLAAYIASLGYKIAVVGRQMFDARLDEFLVENRRAMKLENIGTTESPRRMVRWLKEGGVTGFLIDIDSSRVRGMFMPVFGRLAQTPVGQSIIGLKTKAAFVPIFCLRNADNTYRIVVKPEITIESSGDFDRDVYEITSKCNRILESVIDEYKAQWIWIHNRWCARPGKTA